MEAMLAWGLGVVRFVQGMVSPAMTIVMKGLSFLGTEWFFLAALPLIYWCVDRRKGVRISLIFLFSSFLNLWLKDLFAQPRPYDLDPKAGLAHETSYGLPSGHAQGTLVFWVNIAKHFKASWSLILAIALPILVALSRLYLGVHFPTDILGGWLAGGLLLLLDHFFGDRLEKAFTESSARAKVIAAAAIALLMNAADMRDTSLSGVFFGAMLGFSLLPQAAPFKTEGSLGQKIGRYASGLAGAGILYFGLKAVLPGPGTELYALCRFLRYAVLGAWVALGAPWLFCRLGLAEREAPAEAGDHSASL
jgi:membrane-associated phospholipid phosphatase